MSYKQRKKKSLFKNYLAVSMLIVFISFLILGVMLVFFVTQYSETEKRDLLSENAHSVANMISEKAVIVNDSTVNISETEILHMALSTISSSINSSIFITNNTGAISLCSEGNACSHVGHAVPGDIMSVALNREYFENSDLGGMYDINHYTVAVPIIVSNGTTQTAIGACFVSTTSSSITSFTGEITKIFFFAAIATFAIVFCLVGFFSYNLVRPLRQMAEATKKFATGDFSVRVPVTANDEIGELSIAFNNMADSLATSEGTRRSFIANISHELKTPMTTIAGFINGILDGTIPPEKERHYLQIVSTEVMRLSRLVATMLSLSRIDSGALKLNKQRFNMTDIVINTMLTFEQKIDARHIEIRGLEEIEPHFVDGDPDMLHQVTYNLVENAVKFVNEGGYIDIRLTETNNMLIVAIKNSGMGINSEELSHIFERFYKTDKSRSMDKNGMGLGLYIVKTIMRLHGGDIKAESTVGEFTQFTFWLPIEKDKESKKQAIINSAPKKELGGNNNE